MLVESSQQELRAITICTGSNVSIGDSYQKIQVVVHVVEQTADHGRQVNYVGGLVSFE